MKTLIIILVCILALISSETNETNYKEIPNSPRYLLQTIKEKAVILKSAPFKKNNLEEKHISTRWRLFTRKDIEIPIFDTICNNSENLRTCNIPFPLDTGFYLWDAAYKNNKGLWSKNSSKKGFRIKKTDRKIMYIKDVSFYNQKNFLLDSLIKQEWITLQLDFKKLGKFDSSWYVVVQIHNENYTFGHHANKGGTFSPESNYIINLAYNLDEESITVFEKGYEETQQATQITRSVLGYYIDGMADKIIIDTTLGIMRINFHFLDQVLYGNWIVDVWVHSGKEEIISNIFRKRIRVIDKKTLSNKEEFNFTKELAIGILLVIFVLLFFKWNKKKEVEDQDYIRVINYIRKNPIYELSEESISLGLSFEDKYLRKILKKQGMTLKNVISKVKDNN